MPKATYVIDFDGTTLCRPDDLSQAGYPDHDSEPVRAAINALTASAFTLAQRCGITVCICSGNILASILPHVTRHGFAPDLIACKIGTELWQRQVDGRYRQDAAHRKRMCANFDAVRIAQTVTAFFQTRGVHVTPHAAVMNGPGKTSCHIALTAGRALPDLSPLATALQTQGFYVMLACSL
jgi:hydroxymethylpyrimidine pyrophosphatase-like HAD family hydrolase